MWIVINNIVKETTFLSMAWKKWRKKILTKTIKEVLKRETQEKILIGDIDWSQQPGKKCLGSRYRPIIIKFACKKVWNAIFKIKMVL